MVVGGGGDYCCCGERSVWWVVSEGVLRDEIGEGMDVPLFAGVEVGEEF